MNIERKERRKKKRKRRKGKTHYRLTVHQRSMERLNAYRRKKPKRRVGKGPSRGEEASMGWIGQHMLALIRGSRR